MTAHPVPVAGDRLAEFLKHPPGSLSGVDVTSPPPTWTPLKPLLLDLVRSYRDRGALPPAFSGVPLCLFGSEWPGFPSQPRTSPARGHCTTCVARRPCGFPAEVPDELLPLSEAPPLERWRQYACAFQRVTASDAAPLSTPFVERIMSAYRGPVSLEPSVLLGDGVEPAARVVVFPHRIATGAAAKAEYQDVLRGVGTLLTELHANRCEALLAALGSLPPVPMPVGIEGRDRSWRVKVYLRLEDAAPAERQAVLDALARSGAPLGPVPVPELQMVGLVLDAGGLHTVKAYVGARPSGPARDGFPAPLAADHPLIDLAGDRALATLDLWCRGTRRANKWDFNLRGHYLAGPRAEHLAGQLASPPSAAQLRPLLVGPAYRADVVAVGVRGGTTALYLELN